MNGNPNDYNPLKDGGLALIEIRAFEKRLKIETDCLKNSPLAALSPNSQGWSMAPTQ